MLRSRPVAGPLRVVDRLLGDGSATSRYWWASSARCGSGFSAYSASSASAIARCRRGGGRRQVLVERVAHQDVREAQAPARSRARRPPAARRRPRQAPRRARPPPALTRPTATSNSRPMTDASVRTSRQPSECRWRRCPIASRRLGGGEAPRRASRGPSETSRRPTSVAKRGFPWVCGLDVRGQLSGGDPRGQLEQPRRVRAGQPPQRAGDGCQPRQLGQCFGEVRADLGVAVAPDDQDRGAPSWPARNRRNSSEGASAACRSSRKTARGWRVAPPGRGGGLEQPEARTLGVAPVRVRKIEQLRPSSGSIGRGRGGSPACVRSVSGSRPQVGSQRLEPGPVGGGAARLPAAADGTWRPAVPRVGSAPRRAGSCRCRARRRPARSAAARERGVEGRASAASSARAPRRPPAGRAEGSRPRVLARIRRSRARSSRPGSIPSSSTRIRRASW